MIKMVKKRLHIVTNMFMQISFYFCIACRYLKSTFGSQKQVL
uniref:Uncharacterized protein n=1 Tax=Anguilla anguilla TaxID=7936 RepID=A0A0E9SMX9_ANGAN